MITNIHSYSSRTRFPEMSSTFLTDKSNLSRDIFLMCNDNIRGICGNALFCEITGFFLLDYKSRISKILWSLRIFLVSSDINLLMLDLNLIQTWKGPRVDVKQAWLSGSNLIYIFSYLFIVLFKKQDRRYSDPKARNG